MDMTDPLIPSINIRPEVSMLSVLKHLNYKAWFAVAEFVDNSIQSYLANRDAIRALEGSEFKLRIRIRLDPEGSRIEVSDNAAGISLVDFARAFRPAEIPLDRSGLSEFGMGMKAAACWFTDTWHVRTKALGEHVARGVCFDIDSIVSNKTENLLIEEVPADASDHYTIITLENLGAKFPQARTQKKLKDHLTSIYRMFLRRDDIELLWDEDAKPLVFSEVAILEAPPAATPDAPAIEWRRELNLEFDGGKSIHGFAALRAEGSTTHAGFALFRRNRLIVGSDDETFRPQEIFGNANSYRFQRLFGELHVEGFGVSHTKDGFKWDELEQEVLEKLRAALEGEPLNLLKQAEQHRARPTKAAIKPAAQKATVNVTRELERAAGSVLSIKPDPPALERIIPPTPALFDPEPVSQRSVEILVDGKRWVVSLRMSLDPNVPDWLRFSDETLTQLFDDLEEHRLTVDVSLAHPFVERFIGADHENTELILRFATAIAVALARMQHGGQPAAVPLHYINRLLRESLSENPQ
jgi:hypothetical protein